MNKRQKQLSFFNDKQFPRTFGGDMRGKRKSRRPLSTKAPIHLILRASANIERKNLNRAFSFYGKKNAFLLQSVAKKFGIQIYQSVFNFTHLHMVLKIPSREAYAGFIRVLSSRLASLAGLSRGQLFTLRPYTRVADWGQGFRSLILYIKKNAREAIGGVDIRYEEIWAGLESG